MKFTPGTRVWVYSGPTLDENGGDMTTGIPNIFRATVLPPATDEERQWDFVEDVHLRLDVDDFDCTRGYHRVPDKGPAFYVENMYGGWYTENVIVAE